MKSIAPLFSLKNIVLSLLFMSMAASVAASPKREMRGVWIATVWGIDWPSKQGVSENIRHQQQQQLSDILDRCKQMNLTTVCFQVRGMADVMFRSELE
ncbi:family 10 glycosylhydrolase, partial [uncultured Duncaniella sp.]